MGSIGHYIFRTTLSAFAVIIVCLTALIWVTQALRELELMTDQGQTALVFLQITTLIIPHLVRSRATSDHRVLMPCSFFLGGVLLAFCDSLGRVLLAPAEIPAGAIMAVLGGPYLVWLVHQRL